MTTAPECLRHPVVVFSKNYLPINQIPVKRALVLLVSGKAEPLELDDCGESIPVHSPTMVFFVPPLIRLTINHIDRAWRIPGVTRREVLRRDKHACQYCGSTQHLTLDHVFPRSRGGGATWDNIVTACESCNSRKGGRTPEEADMPLRSRPKPPSHPVVAFAEQFWREHKRRQTAATGK